MFYWDQLGEGSQTYNLCHQKGACEEIDIGTVKPPGGSRLGPREKSLVQLAAAGHSDRSIAEELGISLATVKSYWVRLRQRLGATNRTEAVALALEASRLEDEIHNVCVIFTPLGQISMSNLDSVTKGETEHGGLGDLLPLLTAVREVASTRETRGANVEVTWNGLAPKVIDGTLLPVYDKEELSAVALIGKLVDQSPV